MKSVVVDQLKYSLEKMSSSPPYPLASSPASMSSSNNSSSTTANSGQSSNASGEQLYYPIACVACRRGHRLVFAKNCY